MEVIDAPEMNQRQPITSRIVHTVPCHTGDARKLARAMGYTLSYAYYEQGYALTIGSIALRIYQVFQAKHNTTTNTITIKENGHTNHDPEGDGELEGVAIGDGSTWIVHADIEVQSSPSSTTTTTTTTGSPDTIKKATDELMRLKKELQGYVDLIPLLDELR